MKHDIRLRPSPLLVLLGFLASSLAQADDVDLQIKLARGKSWKVDQTVDLVSDAPPAARTSGGGMVSVGTLDPYSLKETWTDACLKDDGGKPSQIQRTFASSKIAPAKKPASPTGLEGSVVTLTAAEKKCTTKADKGKPEALALKLLERGPLDLITLLLPDKLVAEGGEWEIAAEQVANLQMIASAGVAASRGAAATDLKNDISKLGDDPMFAGATSAACIVKAKLSLVKDGIATIDYSGKLDTKEKLGGAQIPNMPNVVTEVTGSLTFNVKTGQPVKLIWSQRHTAEAKDIQDPGVGKGQVPGMSEEWKLTRTYTTK